MAKTGRLRLYGREFEIDDGLYVDVQTDCVYTYEMLVACFGNEYEEGEDLRKDYGPRPLENPKYHEDYPYWH